MYGTAMVIFKSHMSPLQNEETHFNNIKTKNYNSNNQTSSILNIFHEKNLPKQSILKKIPGSNTHMK